MRLLRFAFLIVLAQTVLSSCGPCAPTPPTEHPARPALEDAREALEQADAADAPSPAPGLVLDRHPVIDAHTHIGARAYSVAFKLAGQNGIQRLVNLSGGYRTRQMRAHQEAIASSGGRLAVFFNLDWSRVDEPGFGDAMADALERAVEAGYAGLKVSKALGLGVTDASGSLISVDDPRLDPIWERAGELKIPVAIHTGDPKAFFEPLHEDNERFEELSEAPSWSFADPKFPRRETLLAQRDRVLAKHPETTFILVHFANNPEDLNYVDALLNRYPNAYVDVSARLAEIGRHDAEKVRALFTRHKTRILFGSDIGVRARRHQGEWYLHLFLGSISKEPPTLEDVAVFFDRHWRFFEADLSKTGKILHPVPIQGRWKVSPVHLPPDLLKALYHDNAYRLIFAPMYARQGVRDPLGHGDGSR